MKLKVALGADHGGFALKNELVSRLHETCEILDLGAHIFDTNDDYPDFTLAVSGAVASGQAQAGYTSLWQRCGRLHSRQQGAGGPGMSLSRHILSTQGVEHDDMNVVCLGSRVIGIELATELVEVFLNAHFSGETRHRRRFEKVLAIEH